MLRRLTTVGRTAGWNDIGIHNPSMHTPAIDKLANGGVILDHHYVYK